MSSNSKTISAPGYCGPFLRANAIEQDAWVASAESSPEAILVVDAGSTIIAYANPAAAALLGQKREEIIGTAVDLLDARKQQPELHAAVQELIHTPNSATLNDLRSGTNQSLKWIEPSAFRFNAAGSTYVQCTLRDVTIHRIDAERTEMRRRFEALQRLAGGLSHDVNNMLTCIRGYASIILETPGLSDDIREMVQLIDGAGIRATELSRRFLEFSRPGNFEPKPTNIAEYFRRFFEALQKVAEPTARLRLGPIDEDLFAMIDEAMLTKALAALIQNAREALPVSEIEISARGSLRRNRSASPTPTSTVPVVEIFVTDTGRGMTVEMLEQAFEPGFGLRKSTDGPGMGLPTVYRIAQEHGGEAEITSQQGRGTTVVLVLPRLVRIPSAAEIAAAAASDE